MLLNLLVIGTGDFVFGKGGNLGTIAPSLFFNNQHCIQKITFISKSKKSCEEAKKRFNKIYGKSKNFIRSEFFNLEEISLSKLISSQTFDAAIISTPDHTHCEISVKISKKKISSLVVKPMALTLSDCRRMIDCAEKNEVYGCVEFHKRFDILNLSIRDYLNQKKIGELLYSVINYSQPSYVPKEKFKKWAANTNVFSYLGVHYVDLIYFFTGFIPISVSSWGQDIFFKKNNINTFDSIQTIVEWKKPNGQIFISSHNTNWIDSENSSAISEQNFYIVGINGKISSDQKHRGLQIVSNQNGIEDINPYFSTKIKDSISGEYFFGYGEKSISQFLIDIMKLKKKIIKLEKLVKNRSSYQNSVISIAVIEAATKSLENNNKKVRINLK